MNNKIRKKILFVCLGNICRSSAAEGIMLSLLKREGWEKLVEVDSAGILNYHQGEWPDARMRAHAIRRGYDLVSRSRQVKEEDFDHFDMIIGMDDRNMDNLRQLAPSLEDEKKLYRMVDFCRRISIDHVPDPYYGGTSGFEQVLDILEDACEGVLEQQVRSSIAPPSPASLAPDN